MAKKKLNDTIWANEEMVKERRIGRGRRAREKTNKTKRTKMPDWVLNEDWFSNKKPNEQIRLLCPKVHE